MPTEAEAIEAWNTRPDSPVTVMREALAETHNERAELLEALERIAALSDREATTRSMDAIEANLIAREALARISR